MTLAKNLDDVVDSYSVWLESRYPGRATKYRQLLASNRAGASVEAITFTSLSRVFGYEVEIAEVDGSGGPDFRCKRTGDDAPRLIVEATSLDSEAISAKSGIPNQDTRGVVSFSYVTNALQAAAKRKAAQVADQPCPRVVVVGSTHAGADVLFDTHAAVTLMLGEAVMRIPVDGPSTEIQLEGDLGEAAFFKWAEGGKVTPLRRSISAILLVGVFDSGSHTCGLLHPAPVYPFAPELLPGVPFLRVKTWPPKLGEVTVEWTVGHPRPVVVPLTRA